jgi:hypothetical protein
MKDVCFSGDEDQANERVDKLATALKGESLGAMLQLSGVGVVSCIIQRDEGRAPTRHCFHWSDELHHFSEEPLLRQVEPPLSNLLELVLLSDFPFEICYHSHLPVAILQLCIALWSSWGLFKGLGFRVYLTFGLSIWQSDQDLLMVLRRTKPGTLFSLLAPHKLHFCWNPHC